MRKCSLIIVTLVDGQETSFSCQAEMEGDLLFARLQYIQDDAKTIIEFKDRKVAIIREGDYSMRLNLEEEKILLGKLKIGTTEGEFPVKTQKIAYTITEKSLLASLHYQLMFEGGIQEMKIRLNAREIYSEEK